jgi:hypothetical protein
VAQAPGTEERSRPALLLFVYSWDLLLAILAVFGALAPFAGGAPSASGTTREVPLPVQILAALSSAAYAAVLIMVASVLTRRRSWVRVVQMAVMGIAVPLAGVSVLVLWLVGAQLPVASVLVALLFVLVDTLTIVLMTERRVLDWYTEPGTPPAYVTGTLVFWAASGCAVIAFQAVLR